jgi:hypothetical protein
MVDTSNKAYAEVQDIAEAQRIDMHLFVKEHEGLTSSELGKISTTYDRYQFARRLPELRKEGLVYNSNDRKCTVTKRTVMTWISNGGEQV